MKVLFKNSGANVLVCLVMMSLFSMPVVASVKYRFVVTAQPAGDFFKPMVAEMVLSDEAVAAGQASNGQIESLVISGGPAMQETNRITLAYLHNQFYDLTVNLSADRYTVTSLSAKLTPDAEPIDYWVFHYRHPENPTLAIHEFLAYVRPDSVTLETTILPPPPTRHIDRFNGQWRRAATCWICRYPYSPTSKWPICWLDWIVVAVGMFIVISLVWRWRRKKTGS